MIIGYDDNDRDIRGDGQFGAFAAFAAALLVWNCGIGFGGLRFCFRIWLGWV